MVFQLALLAELAALKPHGFDPVRHGSNSRSWAVLTRDFVRVSESDNPSRFPLTAGISFPYRNRLKALGAHIGLRFSSRGPVDFRLTAGARWGRVPQATRPRKEPRPRESQKLRVNVPVSCCGSA
jgi:hypothetical protein